MLAELNIVVFLKSNDDLERMAGRVFGALGSEYRATVSDEGDTYYEGSGLGFRAELFSYDPYIEYPPLAPFGYELDIISRFWDPDLDAAALDDSLGEYYARELAFELNIESASEVPIETTDEYERLRVRIFRRNPQYRLDQAPTTPRVFLIEEHFRELPFNEEGQVDAALEEFDDESEDLAARAEEANQ